MSRSRTFVARYSGECELCGFDFEEGDSICYLDDELVHLSCADDESDDDLALSVFE